MAEPILAEPVVVEVDAARGPILLVDDDDSFVDLIERHLQAHGYLVKAAATVEATHELLDAGLRPALLILDINLPDGSGWSLLRDQSLVAAGSPPVVIMSGTQIRPDRLREFKVAGYLPKPISMALLTSCIARLIREPGRNEADAEAAAETQAALEVLE